MKGLNPEVISWVGRVWSSGLTYTDIDWRFDNLCGSHLQGENEKSVDDIILWLLTWLVNYVAMLSVRCHLSRDVIGYEDS